MIEPGRLASYLGLVVAAVALGRWLSFDPWRAEAVPVLVCAMTFAVAYNQWLAGLTGLAVSAIVVFSTTADLGHLLVLSSAAAAAVLPLARVPSRSTVIGVGLLRRGGLSGRGRVRGPDRTSAARRRLRRTPGASRSRC